MSCTTHVAQLILLIPLHYALFIVSQKLIKFATWNKRLIWKLKLLTTAQLQS